jgi:predicted O-methyltransferase YrrM
MLRYLEKKFVQLNRQFGRAPIIGALFRNFKNFARRPIFDGIRLQLLIMPRVREVTSAVLGDIDTSAWEKEALETYAVKSDFGVKQSGVYNLILAHILIRARKMQVVIETGISSGRSSTAFLEALCMNNEGTLYSFDLDPEDTARTPLATKPEYAAHYQNYTTYAPVGVKAPGWLVPDFVKSRWVVTLGDSNITLPKKLSEIGTIDMFYHDSDHTYETMTHEFNEAWPRLRSGGLLLVDNASTSNAYPDFIEKHRGEIAFHHYYSALGVILKK